MQLTVRFSAQNSLFSWWIRLFLWSPFSHVDVVLPNGDTLGARLIGGVKVRPPAKRMNVADVVIEVPEEVLQDGMALIGSPYDVFSLFSFLFRVGMQHSKWYTCVELWTGILKKHGVIVVPNEHRINPFQLYLILTNLRKA